MYSGYAVDVSLLFVMSCCSCVAGRPCVLLGKFLELKNYYEMEAILIGQMALDHNDKMCPKRNPPSQLVLVLMRHGKQYLPLMINRTLSFNDQRCLPQPTWGYKVTL